MLLLCLLVTSLSMASFGNSHQNKSGEIHSRFWSNISSGDPLVHTMWSVSHRHVGFERFQLWVETCLDEFNNRSKAVGPFLVTISIKSNTYFLEKFVHYDVSTYATNHDIARVSSLHEELLEVSESYDEYRVAAYRVIEDMDPRVQYKLECPSKWHCGCLSSRDIREFQSVLTTLQQYGSSVKTLLIFGGFVDPALRLVIVLLGLTLNGAILTTLIKHRDLNNALLLNLSVIDLLYLLLYAPAQYAHYYYDVVPRTAFLALESCLFSASAFSVLALYVQRYSAAAHGRAVSPLAYILCIWACAVAASVLVCVLKQNVRTLLELNPVSGVYLTLLKALPIAIFVLSRMTPDTQEHLLSSRLARALCLSFWFTHTPLFMWLFFERGVSLMSAHFRYNHAYVELTFYYVLFLYPLLNPLLMYKLGRQLCGGLEREASAQTVDTYRVSDTTDTLF